MLRRRRARCADCPSSNGLHGVLPMNRSIGTREWQHAGLASPGQYASSQVPTANQHLFRRLREAGAQRVRRWMYGSSPISMTRTSRSRRTRRREGTPVTSMMPTHIPMFWKAWKPNQQSMPAAAIRPKTSSLRRRSPGAPEDDADSAIRPRHRPGRLLAGDREDESVLLGTNPEFVCGLRRALAEETAVAIRRTWPARRRRRRGEGRGRVGEGHKRSTSYCSRNRWRPRDRPETPDPSEHHEPPPVRAGGSDHAEDGRGQHEHRAEVGLRQDQDGGEAGDRQHQEYVDRTDPVAPRPSLCSATTSAMPMTTASSASSEGWSESRPTISHDLEPSTAEPMTSTSTRPTTAKR